jgi:hypothetical protein
VQQPLDTLIVHSRSLLNRPEMNARPRLTRYKCDVDIDLSR